VRQPEGLNARQSYGVGYGRVPRIGVIERLHALDAEGGRALCGQTVAMAWSPQDSACTEIDCRRCLDAIERREQTG
jgi:hypothetical protein